MAKKVLVPVLPTDRFYDAVVAAGSLLNADHGGLVVFLFTEVRPPEIEFEKDGSGRPDLLSVEEDVDDEPDPSELEEWRQQQVAGLEEARQLLRERGIDDRNVEYAFADSGLPRAEAIAEEASAGAYDAVILPSGFVQTHGETEEQPPEEIARELRELNEVRVYVV
jgi:nucleotide-binding universal stress UspA family protein